MTKHVKVLRMGRAAGKTTQAIQVLSAEGGGIFLTRHVNEAIRAVKLLRVENVKIVSVELLGHNLVIDDSDQYDLTLVTNTPLELREI